MRRNGNIDVGKNGNGSKVLEWEWKWDENGNDSSGMGGNVNNNSHSRRTPVRATQAISETNPVASLGWVTPGAATESVTPLFLPEIPGDLFLVASFAMSSLFILFSSQKLTTSLGCHPLEGVTRGGPPAPT